MGVLCCPNVVPNKCSLVRGLQAGPKGGESSPWYFWFQPAPVADAEGQMALQALLSDAVVDPRQQGGSIEHQAVAAFAALVAALK